MKPGILKARNLVRLIGAAATTGLAPIILYAQEAETAGELEEFVGYAGEDPNFVLPNESLEGVLGFSKKLIETPRSASVVSSEMIDALSISEVSDLSRIVPGTNTTTRWGVQGNIDVRNMTADTYFRGMKRIEPQGNSRTVLGANDQIQIVRGPPPPFFGPGKIGGYTNLIPKSGRSQQGAYLEEDTGFIQMVAGNYQKREVSFGYGGATPEFKEGLRGGYYIYGMLEDSESFYENIPIEQRVLQAAVSQEISDQWRIETGINFQETETAGGFRQRLTQETIDNGLYWAGSPLVALDTDRSGKIGVLEMENSMRNYEEVGRSSTPGSTNRALRQRFQIGRFADAVNGVSPLPDVNDPATWNDQSALQALLSSPNTSAEFINGLTDTNLRMLNVLPQGFVLDPSTVRLTEADWNHVALEKELFAQLGLIYFDLVNDLDPDRKFKNQILIDTQDQFKDSELPFYQKQDIFVFENKFTAELRPTSGLPDWLELNTISAVNLRYTDATRKFSSGDYDDRSDLSLPSNVRTPDDLFVTARENPSLEDGGAPFDSDRNSEYWEAGVGTLLDFTLYENLNILAGGRYDFFDGETTDYGGTYIHGTAGGNSGSFRSESSTSGDDHGGSYSISLRYELPHNINPYFTYASQSVLSDNSALQFAQNIIENGPIDTATLKEAGIKGSHFEDKLFWAVTAYEQERGSVTEDDEGNPLRGGLGDILSEGIEFEMRWAPNKHFWISGFSTFTTVLLRNTGGAIHYNGPLLGFDDVKDANGEIIYPAEAFTWGGRAGLPVDEDFNTEHPGFPDTSAGLSGGYSFDNGFSFGGSFNYISEVHSGRAKKIILPEAYTFNVFLSYKYKGWRAKLDVLNVTDEEYFRGRNGASRGDVLITRMPNRSSKLTISKSF